MNNNFSETVKNMPMDGVVEQPNISMSLNRRQTNKDLIDMLTKKQLNYPFASPVNIQIFTAFAYNNEGNETKTIKSASSDSDSSEHSKNDDNAYDDDKNDENVEANNGKGGLKCTQEDIAEFFPFMRSADYPLSSFSDDPCVNRLQLATSNPYSFERNRNQAVAYALAQSNPYEFYDHFGDIENETTLFSDPNSLSAHLKSHKGIASDNNSMTSYVKMDRLVRHQPVDEPGEGGLSGERDYDQDDSMINTDSVVVVPSAENSVGIEDLPDEIKFRMSRRSYRSHLPLIVDSESSMHDADGNPKTKVLKPADYSSLKEANVPLVEFNYHNLNVVFRSDIENATLPSDIYFYHENCVYPGALKSKSEYAGSRWAYERECNKIAWEIVSMNPHIQGHKGVVQKAVNAVRNSSSDTRSKKVRMAIRSRSRDYSYTEKHRAGGKRHLSDIEDEPLNYIEKDGISPKFKPPQF